jgi:hypothetical protein
MTGAAEKERRARALVWWGAMLPHLKKTPGFDQFVGVAKSPEQTDWQAELAAWQSYASQRH